MIKRTKLPIAVEGLKLVIPLAVLTIILLLLEWSIAAYIALILTLFVLFFFRDPRREVPQDDGAVVSPADGKVVVVKNIHENDYLHQNVKQISIFLSIFNVHVNRVPIEGTIESTRYNPGKFHIAAVDKASLENEQTAIVIGDGKRKILVKQIAGMIARRIACYVQSGDIVQKGGRLGLIYFGSRVDIFLPMDADITVKLGDRVKGAKDIIALLK